MMLYMYMLKFRIRYEKCPIPDNVNKGNGAVSKNYRRLSIAITLKKLHTHTNCLTENVK